MDNLPDDHFVHATQFTRVNYRDQYPSIDPRSAPLSQQGKVIIITGASQGIGQYGLSAAFAAANPKGIVLVARNAEKLAITEQEIRGINPHVQVLSVATDVGSEESVEHLFAQIKATFGVADVLVNNAGSLIGGGPLSDVSPTKWWNDFEINVKGTFLVTRSFVNLVGKEKSATIINITSGAAISVAPGMSSYCLSKLANAQMVQFIAAEYPNVTAVAVAPGTVMTDMTMPAFRRFAKDTPALVGGSVVWLTTEQAKFLNGRYFSVNWSVDELMQRKDEIVKNGELLIGLTSKLGPDQFD